MGIYDMNGKQGPNTVGKDIGFIGSFYNDYGAQIAAVLPHKLEKKYNENGMSAYGTVSWDILYNYCDKIGKNHEWIMPDINEMSLLYLGKKIVNNDAGSEHKWFFSRSYVPNVYYGTLKLFFAVDFHEVRLGEKRKITPPDANVDGPRVRCVRNNALK